MSEVFQAARAEIGWEVNDGQVNAKVDSVRRNFHEATGGMSDDALRLVVAQEKLDKALVRHGVNSTQAKQAELAYRRELKESTVAVRQHERAVERDHAAIGKAARGALAGSGAFRGFARSIAFASSAFLGGAGLTYALQSSLIAFRESEVAIGRAQTAVKNAGLEWEKHAKQIETVIQKQSYLSAFDDEQLTETFARLVTRTKDVNEALRLNALAADVARARNISLEAATQIVIKASLAQSGQLRRLGLDVEKNASATELLAKLQESYAGSAERYANSSAGAQERFNVAIDNAKELLGGALAPALQRVTDQAADWLSKSENQARIQHDVNEAVRVGGQVAHLLAEGLDAIRAVGEPVVDALGGIDDAARTFLILGLALKLKRTALAFGFLPAASSVARTKVVADMVAMETAAAGSAGRLARLRGLALPAAILGGAVVAGQVGGDDKGKTAGSIANAALGGAFAGSLVSLPGVGAAVGVFAFAGDRDLGATGAHQQARDLARRILAAPESERKRIFEERRARLRRDLSDVEFRVLEAAVYRRKVRAPATKLTAADQSRSADIDDKLATRPGGAASTTQKPPKPHDFALSYALELAGVKAGTTATDRDDFDVYRRQLAYVQSEIKGGHLTKEGLLSAYGELERVQNDIQGIVDRREADVDKRCKAAADKARKRDAGRAAARLLEQKREDVEAIRRAKAATEPDAFMRAVEAERRADDLRKKLSTITTPTAATPADMKAVVDEALRAMQQIQLTFAPNFGRQTPALEQIHLHWPTPPSPDGTSEAMYAKNMLLATGML